MIYNLEIDCESSQSIKRLVNIMSMKYLSDEEMTITSD